MNIIKISENKSDLQKQQDRGGFWTLKDVLSLYEAYFLQSIEKEVNIKDKQLIARAKSNFNFFLKFIIEQKGGNITNKESAYAYYSIYLDTQKDKQEITDKRATYLKMYTTIYKQHPNIKGWLTWLNLQNQIRYITMGQDFQQAYNTLPIIKEFELWLKSRSKLNRTTRYAKVVTDMIISMFDWIEKHNNGQIQINPITINLFLSSRKIGLNTLNKYLDWIKLFTKFYKEKVDKNTPNSEKDDKYFMLLNQLDEILNIPKKETDTSEVERIAIPQEHLQKMLELADDRMKLIIRLGSEMGLRASSLMFLKVEDISFSQSRMDVFLKGRNNKFTLPMPSDLQVFIQEYINKEQIKAGDRLLGFNSQNVSSISTAFSNFLKLNGLKYIEKNERVYKISLHNLRHTFAYNSIDKFGLLMTSKLLCHQSIEITEKHYLKDKIADTMYRIYDMNEEEIIRMKNLW